MPGGKIDRQALAHRAGNLPAAPLSTTRINPAEHLVHAIWSDILGGIIDPERGFFETGRPLVGGCPTGDPPGGCIRDQARPARYL